ncbi:MAG: CinA family protein [Candidatus Hydrogenedentes bacterium]|nr:CinA family protein [Candidatus Hydrogenedentota bacterium]
MTTAERLISRILKDNQTLATAESCTGGLLAATITEVPGVSPVFLGGVVAYSNTIKEEVLEVRPDTLDSFGAVSEEVVEEMVRGVCRKFNAHLGIATTGVAGPTGGTKEKPVGKVFVATQVGNEVFITTNLFGGSRTHVRQRTVEQGLGQLLRMLS